MATTASTVPDIRAFPGIHAREKERGLLPERHYLDAGYSSAEAIRTALSRHGVALITPALLDTSRQARQKEGFATANFTIDWKHRLAVCPMGQTSSSWSPCRQGNRPAIVVTFAKLTCRPCPARPQCTRARSGARQLSLPGEPHADVLLRQRRAEQDTDDWQGDYALRSEVEGTIRQTVAVTSARRARYRGQAKTHLEHVTGACALNIHRLDAWWNERALDRARVSHLARLEINLAART